MAIRLLLSRLETLNASHEKLNAQRQWVFSCRTLEVTAFETDHVMKTDLINIERDVLPKTERVMRGFSLVLTHRCNLSCNYCIRSAGPQADRSMPFSGVQSVITAAVEQDYQEVCLTGGEALLYPHFDRVLSLVANAGLKLILETNGRLLSDSRIRRILDRLDSSRFECMVSLDSIDPEQHDANRGLGAHAAAVVALQRLRAHGVYSHVNCVVSPHAPFCVDAINRYLDYCRELGVDQVYFSRVVDAPGECLAEWEWEPDDLQKQREIFYDHPEVFRYFNPTGFWSLAENDKCARLSLSGFCASPAGITPCLFLTDWVLGDYDQWKNLEQEQVGSSLNAIRSLATAEFQPAQVFACSECRKGMQRLGSSHRGESPVIPVFPNTKCST